VPPPVTVIPKVTVSRGETEAMQRERMAQEEKERERIESEKREEEVRKNQLRKEQDDLRQEKLMEEKKKREREADLVHERAERKKKKIRGKGTKETGRGRRREEGKGTEKIETCFSVYCHYSDCLWRYTKNSAYKCVDSA
jgi:hypothetical protein